ncbi:TniB family NTP-binding protein [Erythrobacter crassostreae]|uniref:TniB family NTP-binding protein n=1 Tax=Erythrobacter crassostreae TaxID=2828328 RepID=A0A9X1F4U6_9SPHN|nr:TniB family NTP-binding protein [Erythrobacter crassostrea]MBV7259353.1 TniB family NTP-binding protein [Erythrobacter crassostrea]
MTKRALASPGERQQLIRDIFVDHPNHQQATKALKHFHMPVEGGIPSRGNICALIGQSRTGKSFAANEIVAAHGPRVGQDGVKRPVLLVDCPIEGGTRGILDSISDALDLTVSTRITNANLINLILRELRRSEVEYVIFDEAQELFPEKNKRILNFARGLLRKMLNLKQFNIACIGLPETYSIIAEDPQLFGRGGLEHLRLSPYDWNDPSDSKSFRALCHKFDSEMPFEKSGFGAQDFSYRLYLASGGCIGHLKNYLIDAGNRAIADSSEQVELRHFADAFDARKKPGETFNPFRPGQG